MFISLKYLICKIVNTLLPQQLDEIIIEKLSALRIKLIKSKDLEVRILPQFEEASKISKASLVSTKMPNNSALLPDIIELASDTEHQIRQFTLESLISIAHHLPELLRGECETLSKIITGEVELKKELIKEVDLGPFKHKIDEGRPIRKAGLVLLDTMFEKMPERINVPVTLDIILIGLSDPDDDCVAQALHILIKMVKWAPGAVVGQMSNILDKLPPILKTPEKGTTKSSYRIALKAMERMSHIPDMETNTVFQKFVQDNHITMEE